ncbi:MAG TPA: hypothetical protein VFU82_03320 [Gammaproteobacteria bacterium]|nr:hypothetical protein [Gammaproteobacteria bacterium]
MIDLTDSIQPEEHYKKICRGAQKIRGSLSIAQAPLFLNELFDYLITDLKEIAEQIYEKVLLLCSSKAMKITPTKLQNLIKNKLESILINHDRVISSHGMGGMFRSPEQANKDIQSFKDLAKKTCAEESWKYSIKYNKHLKKQASESKILFWSRIAGVTSLIAVATPITPKIPHPSLSDLSQIIQHWESSGKSIPPHTPRATLPKENT